MAPRVWVDFNKGSGSRVYLTTLGTKADLERQGITLFEGMTIVVWDDDVEVGGEVHNDPERGWFAQLCEPHGPMKE